MRMESGNTRISGMDILGLSQSDDDPHLALFDRLNAFTRGRQLRRYQRDIWLSGRFTIELPGNREPRQADGTLLAEVKAYAWRFPGAEGPLWLTSTGPNLGYAISAIINPKDKTIILAPEGDVEITALFARAITGNPSIAGNPSEAILLAGHENFAHFIWNELPALLELDAATFHPRTRLDGSRIGPARRAVLRRVNACDKTNTKSRARTLPFRNRPDPAKNSRHETHMDQPAPPLPNCEQ